MLDYATEAAFQAELLPQMHLIRSARKFASRSKSRPDVKSQNKRDFRSIKKNPILINFHSIVYNWFHVSYEASTANFARFIGPFKEITLLATSCLEDSLTFAEFIESLSKYPVLGEHASNVYVCKNGLRISSKFIGIEQKFGLFEKNCISNSGWFDILDNNEQKPVEMPHLVDLSLLKNLFDSKARENTVESSLSDDKHVLTLITKTLCYESGHYDSFIDGFWRKLSIKFSTAESNLFLIDQVMRDITRSYENCHIRDMLMAVVHFTDPSNAPTVIKMGVHPMPKYKNSEWMEGYFATPLINGKTFISDHMTDDKIANFFSREYSTDFVHAFNGAVSILSGTVSNRTSKLYRNPHPNETRQEVVDDFVSSVWGDGMKVLLTTSISINGFISLVNGIDIEHYTRAVYRHKHHEAVPKSRIKEDDANWLLAEFASTASESNTTALVHIVKKPDTTKPDIQRENDKYLHSTQLNLLPMTPTGIMISVEVVREIDLFKDIGNDAAVCRDLLWSILKKERLDGYDTVEFTSYNEILAEQRKSNNVPLSNKRRKF